MTTVKTTVNIDEKVWKSFKNTVNRRYGGSRNLSKMVEEAIRNYNTLEILRSSAKTLEIEISEYPSSTEIEANRPVMEDDSTDIIREMRDDRESRLLGQ